MNIKKAAIGAAIVGAGLIGGGYLLSQPSSTPVATEELASECQYSCSSPDRDCSDFSSHRDAQDFFECCGFTTANDPMKLDSVGVGDGIACESLP